MTGGPYWHGYDWKRPAAAILTPRNEPCRSGFSEDALKAPKRHQAVSGYWHTLTTLAGYCCIRSYLVSTRNHGVRAIDAIHTALTGNPWLPRPATA